MVAMEDHRSSKFPELTMSLFQQLKKVFKTETGQPFIIADDASGDYVTTSDGKRIVDHENIQRSRLRVDARKWAAARLAPKKYGDRVEHDVKGGIGFQPAVLVQIGGGDQPMKTISDPVTRSVAGIAESG